MKNILLIIGVLIIIAGAAYYFLGLSEESTYNKTPVEQPKDETVEIKKDEVKTPTTTQEEVETKKDSPTTVIGQSVSGNDITAYHFGNGEKEILFIGGIHGGYSWNTALLGFELVDWLQTNEKSLPENLKVTVIPVLNPDGLKRVTGTTGRFTAEEVSEVASEKIAGRFNTHEVDLNRNFDCEWQPTSAWQNKTVSGGTAAFSEPESQAIRSYVIKNKLTAVVTWYSAAGGVYASNCKNGVLPETLILTNLFAKAAGYPAHEQFNYYEISGDMVNWLASQKIPAISVLLTNHEQTEFTKNQAGVEAILKHYAE